MPQQLALASNFVRSGSKGCRRRHVRCPSVDPSIPDKILRRKVIYPAVVLDHTVLSITLVKPHSALSSL
jgi:hypothetical protein